MVEGLAAQDFRATQRVLVAHLRDPEGSPRPRDIEERRLAVYRDLIYSNLESLLAANFPVLKRILPLEHWRAMVRDFLARHRADTPLFTELAKELLDYLAGERPPDPADPPFLLELAHYEWVELALHIADETPDSAGIDPDGDLLAAPPRLSPLAWPLSYRFPVHRIGPDFQPDAAPAERTHLLVYRDPRDRVAFMETNAVTQRLVELLQTNPECTGREHLLRIAEELRYPDPERLIAFGAELLESLRACGAILGTRR